MSTLTGTDTTHAPGRARPRAGGDPTSTVAPIAPPPKLRRRPLLALASVAAIVLGALLAALAYTATSTAREVVAVRADIQRGELIGREDLITVRVGLDPALHTVSGSSLDGLVGQRAAADLPAGSLVTPGSVTPTVLPGKGSSIVGVSLPPSLLPGEDLRAGDTVRVVATPGQQGDMPEGEPAAIAATVVGVHPDPQTGQTVVSVQVPYAAAAQLAARAATGKVALVLDPRER